MAYPSDWTPEQRRAELFFRHWDRISELITDPNLQSGQLNLNAEAAWSQVLARPDAGDDADYVAELALIQEDYTEKTRPGHMSPDEWMQQKRIKELGAVYAVMCRVGPFAEYKTPYVKDAL